MGEPVEGDVCEDEIKTGILLLTRWSVSRLSFDGERRISASRRTYTHSGPGSMRKRTHHARRAIGWDARTVPIVAALPAVNDALTRLNRDAHSSSLARSCNQTPTSEQSPSSSHNPARTRPIWSYRSRRV